MKTPRPTSGSLTRPYRDRGEAHTQIGGGYNADGQYQGGWWIVVDYGRPILRGRANMFGSGDTYGDAFLLGPPNWRIGANMSTRFYAGTDLMFGNQRWTSIRQTRGCRRLTS